MFFMICNVPTLVLDVGNGISFMLYVLFHDCLLTLCTCYCRANLFASTSTYLATLLVLTLKPVSFIHIECAFGLDTTLNACDTGCCDG